MKYSLVRDKSSIPYWLKPVAETVSTSGKKKGTVTASSPRPFVNPGDEVHRWDRQFRTNHAVGVSIVYHGFSKVMHR